MPCQSTGSSLFFYDSGQLLILQNAGQHLIYAILNKYFRVVNYFF